MSMLRDSLRPVLLPPPAQPGRLPTCFEIDLRQTFTSHQRMPGFCRLAIDLRPHKNVEGYDFEYLLIPTGDTVNHYLTAMRQPAVVLDLRRPFDDQWPRDFIGVIDHPRQLTQPPFQGRLPLFDPPKVTALSDYRR